MQGRQIAEAASNAIWIFRFDYRECRDI